MTDAALIKVAAGVLQDLHGRILIAQRPPGGHVGGCWEFPGGKLKVDEPPAQALERELMEELGVTVEAAVPFITYQHAYAERTVELHVFLVERYAGVPRGVEGQPLRWVTKAELASAGLLEADWPIVAALIGTPALISTPALTGAPGLSRS